MEKEYVKIGKILTTHGIKGELKVKSLLDDILDIKEIKKMYIGENYELVHPILVREHKNSLLIKFKEYDNINEVLNYKDSIIYAKKNVDHELKEDEYYVDDIIGLKAINLEGDTLGEIIDIIKSQRNDLFILLRNGEEFMIPGIKEFIKEINVEKKYIVIDPIEGMI